MVDFTGMGLRIPPQGQAIRSGTMVRRDNPWNAKEFGYFMSIGQVGMEMVIPIAIGVALDRYLDWTPWAAISGAVLGFVGGLIHLIALANRSSQDSSKSKRDSN